MRLIKLWIRNFMRFHKAQLNLENQGMVLIEGINKDDDSANSNGAGKSSLVDAIVWCLYGVTTHEPSAEGDDVVNEKRGKNCEVQVTFTVHETLYTVIRRRAWKKGGKAAQLLLDETNQGGESISLTRGTMRDTQDAINKLIGMSVTTFKQSCIFGQGSAYRFSRLTDSEKKGVLDEMLGSEVYARAAEIAAQRATQTELELGKALTSLETSADSLQDARERLVKLKSKVKEAERTAHAERDQMKQDLEVIEAKWNQLGPPADIAKLRTDQSFSKEAEIKAHKELQLVLNEIATLHAEIERLKTERSKLLKLEGATCLLCKQAVSEAHIHTQTEMIDEAIRRSIDRNKQKKNTSEELVFLVNRLQRTTEKCRDAIAAATDQAHKRERIEDQIKALTKKAKAADTSPHWAELIAEAKQAIAKLKDKRKVERKVTLQRKRELAQLRFWQAGFGAKGLRSLLLDSVLPYLNAKLINYTNALTAGNIQIEFRTQRKLKGGGVKEDFHVHVANEYGASKYTMNSVGERAKVDLVVGLALQDMAASRSRVPVNVAFFDEVFDGLDASGIDRAVQVLSGLKRESAFVITHSDGMKVFFQNVITVVKQNGESRVIGADKREKRTNSIEIAQIA